MHPCSLNSGMFIASFLTPVGCDTVSNTSALETGVRLVRCTFASGSYTLNFCMEPKLKISRDGIKSLRKGNENRDPKQC